MSAPPSNLPQIPTAGAASMLPPPPSGAAGVGGAAAAAAKPKKKVTAKKATGTAATKAKAPKKPAAPRPKKPTAASGKKATGAANAASNAEAILADAALARLDLAKQRSIAAQRKSDPLWYRIEDVVFSHTLEDSASMYSNNILPEQISVVERALSNVGGLTRSDVTPQAMICLLEQARRIAYELCMDAQDYAYSAGRADVTPADLQLAQDLRSDVATSSSVTTQLPKLNLTAQQVNRAPLPPIPTQCYTGVVLPPQAHQLTARTFDVVSASMVAQKMTQPVPKSPAAVLAQNQQQRAANASSSVGYGASRGRQIPIALKTTVAMPNSAAAATVPLPSATVTGESTGIPANAAAAPPPVAAGTAAVMPDASSVPTPMDVEATATTTMQPPLAASGTIGNSQPTTVSNPPLMGMIGAPSSTSMPPPGNPPN